MFTHFSNFRLYRCFDWPALAIADVRALPHFSRPVSNTITIYFEYAHVNRAQVIENIFISEENKRVENSTYRLEENGTPLLFIH